MRRRGKGGRFSDKIDLGDPARPAELPRALQEAYAQGARDITINSGTYILPATGRNTIELNSWNDASVHARGATIVFQDLAHRPVYMNRCQRVSWEGGALRFARPAFTQGQIKQLGKDAKGNYLDWQIDAGYFAGLDPVKATLDVAGQQTRLIKPGTGDFGCRECERLAPGLFRLRQTYGLLGTAAVNDWLFTRIDGAGNSVVQLDGCGHCTLRDVTLQNSGFAAFFETGGEGGHSYLGCKVSPGPKPDGATEEQLVGCGADGFHSASTRTGPTIDHCAWEGLLHDDCIAIHGSLQKVEQAVGNKLVLEQGNRGGFVAGEPVRISSDQGYFGEFTCTALRTGKGGHLELTLDRASGAAAGAKASNPRSNGAHFKILNCTLGNCRSRGILVKADCGLIEGCTISGCGMSAISIGPEYYWGEADYSQNVTLWKNTLRNNVLNGSDAGVVFVHGDGAIGNGNIVVMDNFFDRNYGQIAVHVEDTDGVRITGNRFLTSPLPLPERPRTILDFASSRNITAAGNVVEKAHAKDKLVNVGKNVERINVGRAFQPDR